jgi:hypothetical protein
MFFFVGVFLREKRKFQAGILNFQIASWKLEVKIPSCKVPQRCSNGRRPVPKDDEDAGVPGSAQKDAVGKELAMPAGRGSGSHWQKQRQKAEHCRDAKEQREQGQHYGVYTVGAKS